MGTDDRGTEQSRDAPEIRSLDERTVERIAAGEVIERPASAVKELVENSLDAGATRIVVEVEDGGSERIVVRDDGVGMTESAVKKAVQRHTTSKLREATDLDEGITTLGFRGEALYTIAAISHLTIRTRAQGQSAGTQLRMSGGTIKNIDPVGCPEGTVVEVEELFYNTPARREFLSTVQTEFDHINRIVGNYALANPGVAISLHHDGREVFATPGQGTLRGAVLAVWGPEVASSMESIDVSCEDGPIHEITGLLSDPETTRSRPRYISTFVNNRYVTSRVLREAILDGYGSQLSPDRYPFVVLFCTVDPSSVDVNVHPRKMEVRFHVPDSLASTVRDAVRETLLSSGLIRTTAPRGKGRPAETSLDGSKDGGTTKSSPAPNSQSGEAIPAPSRPTDRRFRGTTSQQTLAEGTPGTATKQLPELDILGQLDETYIVSRGPSGLVLIDQHAADERIHFERLRERVRQTTETQSLVNPVELSITPAEAEAFDAAHEGLETIGFQVEQPSPDTLRVSAVPTIIDSDVEPGLIRDAIGACLSDLPSDAPLETVTDEILADMACYPAITGHTRLSTGSMVDLLETLDACENPYACPHGRPVLVQIDFDELEERFERDYPGHGARRSESSN